MIPKFASQELLCPACQGDYLHHDTVEVFERGEDDEHGLHVTVGEGKASINTNMGGNPSSRRHGLLINFSCELCHATSTLSIAQHKGQTEVDFKITRPAPGAADS